MRSARSPNKYDAMCVFVGSMLLSEHGQCRHNTGCCFTEDFVALEQDITQREEWISHKETAYSLEENMILSWHIELSPLDVVAFIILART